MDNFIKLIKATCMELTTMIVLIGGGYAYHTAPDNKANAIWSAVMLVLGYWFGTSIGSSQKNETIDKVLKSNEKKPCN